MIPFFVLVALILPFLFFTDWFSRSYGFLPDVSIRGEIILALIAGFVVLKFQIRSFIYFLSVITPILLVWVFFSQSDGKLLLFDDHASFFYRLEMLKRTFPTIPSYNSLWNGGIEARDYFPTGMLNVFFLFSPIIYLFPLESSYNLIVASLIFILLPICIYNGARLAKIEPPVAAIASLLALTSSMLWYRWCLKYGALGFCTSSVLLALNIGFLIKLLDPEREFSKKEALFFVISMFLMLLWSLTAVAILPLLVFSIFKIRSIWKKKYAKFIIFSLLTLYIPWAATFVTVSNVGKFVVLNSYSDQHAHDKEAKLKTLKKDLNDPWSGKMEILAVRGDKRPFTISEIVKHLREVTVMTNPLLLFLAFPGFWILKGRTKWIYLVSSTWLLILAVFITPFKPQLELDRMYIIATFLLAIPTGASIWSLLNSKITSRRHAFIPACLLAALLISIFSTTAIVHNRREEKYYFTDQNYFRLAKAISQNTESGRALFAGFILHELAYAHIAPLVFKSNTPIVASVPTHSVWWHAELMPSYFIEKDSKGREEYFDLMNATSIIAHEPSWISYFESEPLLYKRVWSKGTFVIYKRLKASNSFFLKGSGQILLQDTKELSLIPDTSSLVLKFNYLPFLQTSSCNISNHPLPGDLFFIELSNCIPGQKVTIKMLPAWQRVFNNFKQRLSL